MKGGGGGLKRTKKNVTGQKKPKRDKISKQLSGQKNANGTDIRDKKKDAMENDISVCVCVCRVCVVVCCVSGPPSSGPPLRRTAQNFAPFFPSPAAFFVLSSLSFGVLAWNFGATVGAASPQRQNIPSLFTNGRQNRVFEGRSAQMCTFGLLGLWCETLSASGPPGHHTTTRELQTSTLQKGGFKGEGASKREEEGLQRVEYIFIPNTISSTDTFIQTRFFSSNYIFYK